MTFYISLCPIGAWHSDGNEIEYANDQVPVNKSRLIYELGE